MVKQIQFNQEALKSILNGVQTMAKAVSVTLGPKGRNVIILKEFGSPISTKDGVSVAHEIILKDKFENMGAQAVKEASSKTNEIAGDGTSTAIVLAEAILSLGVKNVSAGSSPILIKQGMDKAVNAILKELDAFSKPVDSQDEILQIATISASNDLEVGKFIAQAMGKVGKDGTITIQEAGGVETTLDVVEGIRFDKGYVSPYFVTHPDKMMVELDNPYILITDKKISNAKELVPILESVHQEQKPLVIIADDIDGEALSTLVVNKLKAGLKICAVKAPSFGDKRKAILQDIAILSGATFVTEDVGLKLEKVDIGHLGKCKTIKISKDQTTLIGGCGVKESLQKRMEELKALIKKSSSEYEKKELESRLEKFAGGVAIIHVGAVTESELKEKKSRMEDALQATKAAVKEGIVVGGGVALIRASKAIDSLNLDKEEALGAMIIKKACSAPAIAIANNCGQIGALVAEKIAQNTGFYGYNGFKDHFGDLMTDGVVDPVLVTKSALKNASSVAGLLLTIACMITDKPQPKKSAPTLADMGGYDGMDMM